MSKTKLPELSSDISLRDFGYSTLKSTASRRLSLKKASRKKGTINVLRRLNLIRNYNINSEIEPILSSDVGFMSNMYKQVKNTGQIPSRVQSRKDSKRVPKKSSKKLSKKKVEKKKIDKKKVDRKKLSKKVDRKS